MLLACRCILLVRSVSMKFGLLLLLLHGRHVVDRAGSEALRLVRYVCREGRGRGKEDSSRHGANTEDCRWYIPPRPGRPGKRWYCWYGRGHVKESGRTSGHVESTSRSV
ncbi:hypothetical protein GGR56DRAFT_650036 [Xylariaceae sp. FL0804]|nr:hypothetical protein GGR56DRAFT_650036 [Xylariaceae sp. FL0804]